MSPRPTGTVLALLLGACLALLAVFAVLQLDFVPTLPVRTSESDDSNERIERRLSSIESRLGQLQLDLQAIPIRIDGSDAGARSLPARDRAPASPSDELDQLRGAVESLQGVLAGVRMESPAEVRELARRPGDLSTLIELVGGDPADAGFDYEAARCRLQEKHLWWTLPQLLAAHGAPNEVSAGAGDIRLEYAPPGSELRFHFQVTGGYVVSAGFDS